MVAELRVEPAAVRADEEARLWAGFAMADTSDALHRAWLALQCRSIGGVQVAIVVAPPPGGGAFTLAAAWPDRTHPMAHLQGVAERCIAGREPVTEPAGNSAGTLVGYPFLAENEAPAGAVVLHLGPRPEPALRDAVRALHWGIGWLEAQAVRDRSARERARTASLSAALDMVALANEHERADNMAAAVANELAARLGASRVAVGLGTPRGTRLLAMSHTAWFKRKTAAARALAAAMDEAQDQRATVRVPAPPDSPGRIEVAHEALRAHWPAEGSAITVPLLSDRGPVGAITVLHPDVPPDAAVRLLEAAAALLGPGLDAKHRARRWLSGRVADGAHDLLAAVVGPRHLLAKLAGAGAVAALVASVLVPVPFRVSARAVLEGSVQRAVPAPFEGFIARAVAHAGDVVRAGDMLAMLDDKDLQLDRARAQGDHDRLVLKLREAIAKHDPAATAQTEAQMRQTDAQLSLAETKLARTAVVAPVDGLVISGDLSQQIGAPVETGRVLFEVAPLDEYRVVVRVDERDLRFVHPGQRGQVLLNGLTGGTLPFTVTHVTAVAQPDNGRNTFRVDAALDPGVGEAGLRPGMEGIGKIDIDRRSLLSVWTRSLVDWVRTAAWTWTP